MSLCEFFNLFLSHCVSFSVISALLDEINAMMMIMMITYFCVLAFHTATTESKKILK